MSNKSIANWTYPSVNWPNVTLLETGEQLNDLFTQYKLQTCKTYLHWGKPTIGNLGKINIYYLMWSSFYVLLSLYKLTDIGFFFQLCIMIRTYILNEIGPRLKIVKWNPTLSDHFQNSNRKVVDSGKSIPLTQVHDKLIFLSW